jgi:excisionase family DNA binding protein
MQKRLSIFFLRRTDMEALVPIDKAAELLGISPWTVRKYLHDNKLRSVRIGRRRLIEESELRRIIERGRDPEPGEVAEE